MSRCRWRARRRWVCRRRSRWGLLLWAAAKRFHRTSRRHGSGCCCRCRRRWRLPRSSLPHPSFSFCFLISTSALSRPTNREADATSHTGAASNRTHPETVSEAGERLVFLSPPPLSLCACVVYVSLARLFVSVSVSLVSSSRRARGRRCGQPPDDVGSLSSALSGCRRLAQCEKDGTSPQNRNSSFLG